LAAWQDCWRGQTRCSRSGQRTLLKLGLVHPPVGGGPFINGRTMRRQTAPGKAAVMSLLP
jgi:hypothetical protein